MFKKFINWGHQQISIELNNEMFYWTIQFWKFHHFVPWFPCRMLYTLCFTLDHVIPLKANFVTLTTLAYLYNKQEKPPMLFSEFLSENVKSRHIEIKMTMWGKGYFHNHIYGIQKVIIASASNTWNTAEWHHMTSKVYNLDNNNKLRLFDEEFCFHWFY